MFAMWYTIFMFAFVFEFSVGCAAPNIEGRISLYDRESYFWQSPVFIIIIFRGIVLKEIRGFKQVCIFFRTREQQKLPLLVSTSLA